MTNVKPASLKNLKKFRKGESGNPAGMKPGTVQLKTLLRWYLVQKADGKDVTHQDLYVKRLLSKAISAGDMRAVTLIWEAFEGKAKQDVDIKSGGKPIAPYSDEQLTRVAREILGSKPSSAKKSASVPDSSKSKV